jgi:hypothetical protein
MSDFVKNDESESVNSELRVKGDTSVDPDNRVVIEHDRLGIDEREIKLKVKQQIGESLSKIYQQSIQQDLSIGALEQFPSGQSVAE